MKPVVPTKRRLFQNVTLRKKSSLTFKTDPKGGGCHVSIDESKRDIIDEMMEEEAAKNDQTIKYADEEPPIATTASENKDGNHYSPNTARALVEFAYSGNQECYTKVERDTGLTISELVKISTATEAGHDSTTMETTPEKTSVPMTGEDEMNPISISSEYTIRDQHGLSIADYVRGARAPGPDGDRNFRVPAWSRDSRLVHPLTTPPRRTKKQKLDSPHETDTMSDASHSTSGDSHSSNES